MPYRVRTPDGELDFPDMTDIAQAYAAGLVDPNDEVQELGSSTWRKAGSLPLLVGTRGAAKRTDGSQRVHILAACVLGIASLYLLFFREGRLYKTLGLVLAMALAFLLTRVASRAWRRPS
ncbi:hypothetical protein P2318_21880 [Myxococcaceae bacterium GXIMD 01537]